MFVRSIKHKQNKKKQNYETIYPNNTPTLARFNRFNNTLHYLWCDCMVIIYLMS